MDSTVPETRGFDDEPRSPGAAPRSVPAEESAPRHRIHSDGDEIAAEAIVLFRNAAARPRVEAVYTGADGWVDVPGRAVFTRALADHYRQAGVAMVRLAWRFRTRTFSMSRATARPGGPDGQWRVEASSSPH
ncbi:hypothetical protein E3O55_08960 [Cryobacterium sp. MDB1-18-2]|uniref:hypothetical protein n=1 Tax=unclassified Cryobacterium TaxID=2649013 RepID=UPI00106C15E1|nr:MULTISPECIES: hypothetical protein [unclassified Cryobacterium]MEB0002000.1 hypothetical protein [Cryobacterium sp. RTC2.1]MEB0285685.1 hypothetical protein [Cryobacterium sp. 10S3]MEB0305234.1 hypothetical protein [Cryobacterium sp. 10I1]TFC30192.1 hypothetical protein E3O55_08960 [Cryobacterium sp. MDB1-18-2]TFC41472.1 hypothetical protein E3O50_10400 [Cryobacterium sp. MDB1-18-1]